MAWLDKIRERSLQLFREDETRSYNEVMRMLIEEATGKRNGSQQKEGQRSKSEERAKEVDVKIPEKAIDKAIQIVSEGLDNVVQFEGQAS